MKKLEKFTLLLDDAFGYYFLKKGHFVPEPYEMETFDVVEYYKDKVLFFGTLNECLVFIRYREIEKSKELYEIETVSQDTLEYIRKIIKRLLNEIKEGRE